jgi:hypothetical protein
MAVDAILGRCLKNVLALVIANDPSFRRGAGPLDACDRKRPDPVRVRIHSPPFMSRDRSRCCSAGLCVNASARSLAARAAA